MKAETLLCFGGPRNGELLTVERSDRVIVMLPPEPIDWSIDAPDTTTLDVRTFQYGVEKLYLHDERRCIGVPGHHDDWCTMTARCLLAPGYPKERITDTLTGLAKLIDVAPFLLWVSGDQEGTSG